MNVLFINYSDLLGARFNGYDLMRYSTQRDFHYSMMVWNKQSDNPNVYELPPKSKAIKWLIEKTLRLFVKIGFGYIFSIFGYLMLKRTKQFAEADIVHLQIIHGTTNLGLLDIPKLCKSKLVVWTFHDQWALSGGCIHPFSCNGIQAQCKSCCPFPRYDSVLNKYTSRLQQRIKRYSYSKSIFEIIVSTSWMADRVKSSCLLKSHKLNIIPFGVNIDIFKNRGKELCREKLGIPINDFVISIRFTGNDDTMKGFRYAKEAISAISGKGVTVVVFENTGGLDELKEIINVIETGWIDEDTLIDYLSASDVFLMPSLQESFGLMAVESMACETPVIVAEGTALPAIVLDKVGGIVVPTRNSVQIKNAIEMLKGNKSLLSDLSIGARKRVIESFQVEQYVSKHEELYNKLSMVN